MANRCVFLDRDGTINEEVNYLSHPDQLRLIAGAAEAIKLLNQNDYKVVVVTNQAGVARGYFTEQAVREVHEVLEKMLGEHGATIDAIHYCPHHPAAGIGVYRQDCNCRKPNPGMLEKAARELDIDLSASFVVGDKISDLEAGHAVGCRNILVHTGYGQESENEFSGSVWHPEYVAEDLLEATRWILKQG